MSCVYDGSPRLLGWRGIALDIACQRPPLTAHTQLPPSSVYLSMLALIPRLPFRLLYETRHAVVCFSPNRRGKVHRFHSLSHLFYVPLLTTSCCPCHPGFLLVLIKDRSLQDRVRTRGRIQERGPTRGGMGIVQREEHECREHTL